MNQQQFDEFAPLWGSEAKDHVLVNVRSDRNNLQHCVIFNRQRRSAKLIEDPQLALEVMRRMIDAGVEVVDELPTE